MNPLIADDVFRIALDKALKAQNMTKKERNLCVELALLNPDLCRNTMLDEEEAKSRLGKEKEAIPSEDSEQIRFVEWFRSTYPGVDLFYVHNGGSRTEREKVKAKAMGTLAGVSDLVSMQYRLCIEMKRVKEWVHSEEQMQWAAYCDVIGVKYILAIGCDDGIEKVSNYLTNYLKSI